MMLNKGQVKKFEEKLIAEKKDLKEQLTNLDKGLDFGSDVDHFEEESDETEEFSNRLGVKGVLKTWLKRIEKALLKIKGGGYGRCEKCDGEIDARLLETDPESSFCRNCKTKSKKR